MPALKPALRYCYRRCPACGLCTLQWFNATCLACGFKPSSADEQQPAQPEPAEPVKGEDAT